MTTRQTGVEMIGADPDEFMGPRRYRITFHCEKCGNNFSKVLKHIPRRDPPCPNKSCTEVSEVEELRRQVANLTAMVESGRGPAQVGANNRVNAIDETANIVMEDFKMTNLSDRAEPGQGVAPRLPPAMQNQADNYFGGAGLQTAGINKKQAALLGRRAISGAYRDMAVAPNAILPQQVRSGNSPLTVLRTENIGGGPKK